MYNLFALATDHPKTKHLYHAYCNLEIFLQREPSVAAASANFVTKPYCSTPLHLLLTCALQCYHLQSYASAPRFIIYLALKSSYHDVLFLTGYALVHDFPGDKPPNFFRKYQLSILRFLI